MAKIEDNISIDTAVTLSGLVGAMISLRYAKQTSSFGAAVSVIGGTLSATIVAPFVADHVSFLASQNGRNLSAFLVGLFGLNLVAWIFNWLERNGWQGVIDALSRNKK